jgi:hypothetical protein
VARFKLRLLDREIALPDDGSATVGRDEDCDVSIDDPLASRRHATFRSTPGLLSVEDDASRNGVRVNDVRVEGVRTLAHGDRVEIGSHVFLVIDERRGRAGSPTTQSAVHAVTRRVAVASIPRPGRALDGISRAIDRGELDVAIRSMDAILPRFADPSEQVSEHEVLEASKLMLVLAMTTAEARFFDRVMHLHSARQLVPDGQVIDAIQRALPRLPATSLAAIETYMAAIATHAPTLSAQDQVRLRRLASIARRVGGGAAG